MATVNPANATGKYCNRFAVHALLNCGKSGTVSDGDVLGVFPMPCDGRIIGIDAWAGTTGVTSGNTLIDVLTATGATSTTFASLYTTAANRPTIANVTTTGSFITASLPDKAFHKGDILEVTGVVSGGTGATNVWVTIAIGMP